MEYKIKALTYSEQRLEYFQAQIESCKRSLRWWQTSAANRGYDKMYIYDRCSDLGVRIEFYEDALTAIKFIEDKNLDHIFLPDNFTCDD